METLTAEVKISDEGRVEFSAPESFKGATAFLTLTKKHAGEPIDEFGWPVGFWERVYGSIKAPNFKRWPQGEMDPGPDLE